MVPYYMAMQHIQLLEQLLVGQQPIRYNRRNNRLYIDMDWSITGVNEYVVVEAFSIVDPNEFTKVWSDRWLQRYATALIKRQYGENISKYSEVLLPGGTKFNGQKIYNDAVAEIDMLEKELIKSYSLPISYMIG